MAAPDFNQKIIDTLAKRASYKCSNPDCFVLTVGPNSDLSKSTLIGEAAHIYGARPQSKRYLSSMTDEARAEITNGIWLCRNCHKLIDTDEVRYTSNVLFAWREQHEKCVLSDLGSVTDRIQLEQQRELLSSFNSYPPIVHRIILDKPDGWEWRLAAELMRYFNATYFRKINDLRYGYYVKPRNHIGEKNISNWIRERINESSNLIMPIDKLLRRLTLSFGRPGEAGDIHEIHHTCSLIRDYIAEIIRYEEELYFVNVPVKAEKAIALLKDCLGAQIEKLEGIPAHLDEVVSLLGTDHGGTSESPMVIQKTIIFELPKDWSKKMSRELKKLDGSYSADNSYGCGSTIFFCIIFFLLAIFIF